MVRRSRREINLRAELFYVTFSKDAEWLAYSARSVAKYAAAFADVTVAFPSDDVAVFAPLCARHGFRPYPFDEHPGVGHLHHEVIECMADELCPLADVILHVDSDVLLTAPLTPARLLDNGRVLLACVPYEKLREKRHPAAVWQAITERALGCSTPYETMPCLPIAHAREVYPFVRARVERQHGATFRHWVLEQHPTFPYGFCEYNALGACALMDAPDRYRAVVIDDPSEAPSRLWSRQFWSHGGITDAIRADLETIVR